MPHINVPVGVPGIRSLFQFNPETAKPLCDLAEALLRKPSTLTQGERELIASYVSHLNTCKYCTNSHSAFATAYLSNDASVVEKVKNDPETAPISAKLKALLKIAAKVQKDGKTVTSSDIDHAKSQGALEMEIHDTVLIAAAFCMYNRYVDGLGTWAPDDQEVYRQNAERIVTHGYVAIPTKSQ